MHLLKAYSSSYNFHAIAMELSIMGYYNVMSAS